MTGDEAYRWMMNAAHAAAADLFDAHVAAAIIALAIEEADAEDLSITDGIGLTGGELESLARALFPACAAALAGAARGARPGIDAEEQSVRDILMMYASGASALERPFGAMIARRCKAPHHLWQDLGLTDRGELSALMRRHFAPLSLKNSGDMKWKKFLYRMVCGAEGFTLCTSPVCSECDDFADCFGAEDGEARLARLRNGVALAAV